MVRIGMYIIDYSSWDWHFGVATDTVAGDRVGSGGIDDDRLVWGQIVRVDRVGTS